MLLNATRPATVNDTKTTMANIETQAIAKWILIQQRTNNDVAFNRSFAEYAAGFGLLTRGNFYIGNERLSQLTTSANRCSLHIELLSVNGDWYSAEYFMFTVSGSSSGYSITVDGFSGDLNDALGALYGSKFVTYDSCDEAGLSVVNSGWWYETACAQSHYRPRANLNAPFGRPSPSTVRWVPEPPSSTGSNNNGNFIIQETRMMIRLELSFGEQML